MNFSSCRLRKWKNTCGPMGIHCPARPFPTIFLCLEAASLICRGFDYLYYFAFGGYHKDTDEITYKRAWSEHWERIQQGWPSSESIVQMRMDYGGVARKHPLLIFSAFFNPMYGQIIDWALEAMNVDLGKSD